MTNNEQPDKNEYLDERVQTMQIKAFRISQEGQSFVDAHAQDQEDLFVSVFGRTPDPEELAQMMFMVTSYILEEDSFGEVGWD